MSVDEKYHLTPSPNFNIQGRNEVNEDLQLTPSTESESGSVVGTCVNQNGTPVADATVKLFTPAGVPFEHANTNAQGQFAFSRVPVGSYLITASKKGLLTPNRTPITVLNHHATTISITMLPDPDSVTNAVYGIVYDVANNNPIENAIVELFRVQGSNITSEGTVTSNSEGQYLFAALSNGTFYVVANKLGYLSTQSGQVLLDGDEYAGINLNMTVDPTSNTGTVSGIIRDSGTGNPLPNAIVVLYQIKGSTETLIRMSKSNAAGLYLFGNLPEGQYKVKATVQTNS